MKLFESQQRWRWLILAGLQRDERQMGGGGVGVVGWK